MVRKVDFELTRTLGDWLDVLSPARQVAVLEMFPDVKWAVFFTAREIFDAVSDYYGGLSSNQVYYILAELFDWD